MYGRNNTYKAIVAIAIAMVFVMPVVAVANIEETSDDIRTLDNIAVLIDKGLYNRVKQRLGRYIDEVEERFPVNIILYKIRDIELETPEDIRTLLQEEYTSSGIVGAILVGQVPFAIWEQEVGDNVGVSSIFYEDMDGSFEDRDEDGYYDYHNFGPLVGPEIWVSWMRPPELDEKDYLNDFLDKTHAYYTGSIVTNKRAFVACHEDYDGSFYGPLGTVPPLELIYGSGYVDKDGEGTDITVASEIWDQLESVGYEIFDAWQHSSPIYQWWDLGTFTSSAVMGLTEGSLMTFIFGCHSADFWLAPGTTLSNINLAVSYVFGDSIGLASSGTSWSYGTEYKYMIYEGLDKGSYLGEAWYNMESFVETISFVQMRYPGRDPHTECAGNNLIGNPFLYANV